MRPIFRHLTTLALSVITPLSLSIEGAYAKGLFNPKAFTLKNGLEVVVVSDHRVPAVMQLLMYRVGGADEDPTQPSGLAHFFEHMMFRGTKKFDKARFDVEMNRMGARLNAFTSSDYTGYHLLIGADQLPRAMEIESDRMENLRINEEQVNAERGAVENERKWRVENNPSAILDEHVLATHFAAHPYRLPVIGWAHDIAKYNVKEALKFYNQHYVPNNAILVLVGDVTVEKAKELANKYYGPLKKGTPKPRVRKEEPPAVRGMMKVVSYKHPQIQNDQVEDIYHAPTYRSEEGKKLTYPLMVFARHFGGGETSVLYKKLVAEKKIATNAYMFYSGFMRDPYGLVINLQTRTGIPLSKTEEAMREELEKVLKNGVTEKDVELAKERILSQVEYYYENFDGIAYFIGTNLAAGHTIDDLESYVDRVKAVTVKDVNEAIRKIFAEKGQATLQPPATKSYLLRADHSLQIAPVKTTKDSK